MIIDQLKRADAYKGMGPRLGMAFDFLRTGGLATASLGRHEIRGDEVYALVQEYQTKAKAAGKWEAHRRYIDVQYVVSGEELIGYADIERQKPGAYDEGKDFMLLEGDGDFLLVRSGTFMILGPQDSHMPGIAVATAAPVRKVVVKVRV